MESSSLNYAETGLGSVVKIEGAWESLYRFWVLRIKDKLSFFIFHIKAPLVTHWWCFGSLSHLKTLLLRALLSGYHWLQNWEEEWQYRLFWEGTGEWIPRPLSNHPGSKMPPFQYLFLDIKVIIYPNVKNNHLVTLSILVILSHVKIVS